jgi:hypothetical protein
VGDFAKIVGAILLAVVAMAAIAAAIAATIATIAVIAAITLLVYTAWLPGDYFIALFTHVSGAPPAGRVVDRTYVYRTFKLSRLTDRGMAWPSYFFGPAEADARETILEAITRCQNDCGRCWEWANSLIADSENLLVFIPYVGIMIGFVVGTVTGAVIAAVATAVNLILIAAIATVVIFVGMVLRQVDTAMRFLRGAIIRCPNSACSQRIRPYPAYRCPDCGNLHSDIRPGPLGIVSRNCTCGKSLPTLLILGSAGLVAVCRQCGTELHRRTGIAAEIVIPFFGGVGAGKTQLIFTLIEALQSLDGDIRVEPDPETRDRIERIRASLDEHGMTNPTTRELPRPYILHLKIGLSERLIYLFDAAGERHYRLSDLEETGYHDKGATLVFVADPLAADYVWEQLTPEQRSKIHGPRSDVSRIGLAYEQTTEHILRMGDRAKNIRLAFVLTKADLLPATDHDEALSAQKIMRGSGGLDMGNIIRRAEQSFRTVDFFMTAAIADDERGIPHESVANLALWLLRSEGIRLKGR